MPYIAGYNNVFMRRSLFWINYFFGPDFWLNLKLNNPVLNTPHPLCNTYICNMFETKSELSLLSYHPLEHSLCWNILDVSDRDRQVCKLGPNSVISASPPCLSYWALSQALPHKAVATVCIAQPTCDSKTRG